MASQRAAVLKWNWAGHVSKGGRAVEPSDSGLATGHTGHRNIGRPPARWMDDIVKAVGKKWMHLTSNRPKKRNFIRLSYHNQLCSVHSYMFS
ncbi:jg20463 [Pararge aegeria aegeria]|uniref:Jg20463 protein n=1 Tax=Pararge aegeria aegeria TaxID=348720 RepID=A0A8S4QFK6_9NEOP|nr:jg20463 [Pararge aegeria aegeria]